MLLIEGREIVWDGYGGVYCELVASDMLATIYGMIIVYTVPGIPYKWNFGWVKLMIYKSLDITGIWCTFRQTQGSGWIFFVWEGKWNRSTASWPKSFYSLFMFFPPRSIHTGCQAVMMATWSLKALIRNSYGYGSHFHVVRNTVNERVRAANGRS